MKETQYFVNICTTIVDDVTNTKPARLQIFRSLARQYDCCCCRCCCCCCRAQRLQKVNSKEIEAATATTGAAPAKGATAVAPVAAVASKQFQRLHQDELSSQVQMKRLRSATLANGLFSFREVDEICFEIDEDFVTKTQFYRATFITSAVNVVSFSLDSLHSSSMNKKCTDLTF